MLNITRRQWQVLIPLSLESFITAACISVEAPFYPILAIQKSCSVTEIGLVFSIFQFVIFIISPLIGKYLFKFGIKLTFVGGIFIYSIFCVFFGLMNYLHGHVLFFGISLLIKSLEAVGGGAAGTAKSAMIVQEFPENVGTTTAIMEVIISLGFVFGCSVGGVLYELGGYTIPFTVYGVLTMFVVVFASFILPSCNVDSSNESEVEYSMLSIIKIPSVLIALMATLTAAITFGFIQTTLEPFLRQFELEPFILGLVFVTPRVICAITSVLVGQLCDNAVSPKIVIIIGTVSQALSFVIIGPASFIPIKPTLWLVIVGLVIHGFGFAMQFIGSFVDIFESILAAGYTNDLRTNGLVSGSWHSAFSFGAFIGPTLGGILVDKFGFREACIYIFGSETMIGIVLVCYIVYNNKVKKYTNLENEEYIIT